jgi:hypothetical protein
MIKVCQKAALKGRTDVIECANTFGIRYSAMIGEYGLFMETLAKEGNLDMIQYFELPESFDFWVWLKWFEVAEDYEHLDIMRWIFQEKRVLYWADDSDDYDDSILHSMQDRINAYEHIFENMNVTLVTVECGNIELPEFYHQSNL